MIKTDKRGAAKAAETRKAKRVQQLRKILRKMFNYNLLIIKIVRMKLFTVVHAIDLMKKRLRMWRTGYVVMVAKHGFTGSVMILHKNHNHFYIMDVNSYVMYKFLYFNMFVPSCIPALKKKNIYIYIYIYK